MRYPFVNLRFYAMLAILLTLSLALMACGNLTPTEQQTPSPAAPQATDNASTITVTYTYGPTGNVQLSANPVMLRVGQKLIIEAGGGTTGRTRFTSSGSTYVGTFLQQETDPNVTTRVVFDAVKPGTGELQVIPNMTETDRAATLTITVK